MISLMVGASKTSSTTGKPDGGALMSNTVWGSLGLVVCVMAGVTNEGFKFGFFVVAACAVAAVWWMINMVNESNKSAGQGGGIGGVGNCAGHSALDPGS